MGLYLLRISLNFKPKLFVILETSVAVVTHHLWLVHRSLCQVKLASCSGKFGPKKTSMSILSPRWSISTTLVLFYGHIYTNLRLQSTIDQFVSVAATVLHWVQIWLPT